MRRVLIAVAACILCAPIIACAQVTYSNRPPPPPPNYYPNQPPPNYYPGRPPYPPNTGATVTCGSSDYRPASCRIPPGWRGVRIVQQTSKAECVWGRTWGFDRGSIWTSNGCRGRFAAASWVPGPGWDRDIQLSCGSPQYRYNFCQVDVGPRGQVVVQRQISDTRCILNRNWGWNRAGIWVNQGCSARFRVMRRW